MNYSAKINTIIDNLNFSSSNEDNKEIIKSRFVEEVSFYEKKRDHTKRYYNIFRFIVTIGSIFLPAILIVFRMFPVLSSVIINFPSSLVRYILFLAIIKPVGDTLILFL